VADLSGEAKAACNWVTQDVLRVLKEKSISIGDFKIRPEQLADLLEHISRSEFSASRGREVFDDMANQAKLSANIVSETVLKLGIGKVDEGELEALCQELLDANPKIVADVQSGKQQAVGALIGQAKQKNPNVDPGQVRATCLKLIQQ
jgi:aspartyl-tRNA(Asn)/glutamyl-tRNA(Gln) amidotransferase subunit B